jgi:hypothetical protein
VYADVVSSLRSGAPFLLALVLVVAVGCATPEPAAQPAPTTTTSTTSTQVSLPPKALTVADMAAFVGCVPEPVGKTSDFRQANCDAPKEKLVLLDFDTTEGMRAWLDTATMYGGIYLVGDRWVLSSESVEYMETLRSEFGGTIEGL